MVYQRFFSEVNLKTKLKICALLLIAILSFACLAACQPDKPKNINQTVDVYAINDFHGSVDKMPRIAGYLAARKAEGAVILNSGDMFQGSMESNSNYGKLLTDCMVEACFDAMTYGNHEFDWGLDNLKNLASNSAIPFLGANIYNWDRENGWGDFADDLADEYVIVQSGDVKVGVIGVIGEDQITSISSQLVQTIGFKDPLPIIKELATKLREQEGCDIVVASVHAGPQDIVNGTGGSYDEPTTSADLEDYVDAMFCAHTHSEQRYLVNGLPFLQGKRYGDYVSHVQFKVQNGNVSVLTYENIPYNQLNNLENNAMANVYDLINESNSKIESERNQVIAKLSESMDSDDAIPRLVCNAMADYATEQGFYEIDLAICNYARNNLNAGTLTYSNLYEAIPFDNVVYIAKVSGSDIIKEMGFSGQNMWRVRSEPIENSNSKYYTVAIIDYLLYHQNDSRNYNYFPSAFRSGFTPIPLTKEGVDIYNYRLITRDFLLKTSGTINVSIYTNKNNHTDPSKLTQSVTF